MTGPTHLDLLAQLRESRERDRAATPPGECCQNFPHAAHETPCEQPTPADLTDVALVVLGAMEAAGIEGADMHDARLIVDNLTAAGFCPVRAVEAERDEARGDSPSGFWSQREWEDWSNRLAELVPERYEDDTAQEGIIEDALADLVRRAEQAEAREKALRESVEALAEKWRGQREPFGNVLLADLRALLATSPDREDGAS